MKHLFSATLMAIAMAFVLTSCQKESVAPEVDGNNTGFVNRVLEDEFLLKHPEILNAAMEAAENGEAYASEVYTYTPSAKAKTQFMQDVSSKSTFYGLAGTEMIFGPFGGLSLVRNGYTLYGYNVVDDIITTSGKDRFKFQYSSASNWRLTKHYTYDANLNQVTTHYRNIPPGCTKNSFLTSGTNLGIGSLRDCGW